MFYRGREQQTTILLLLFFKLETSPLEFISRGIAIDVVARGAGDSAYETGGDARGKFELNP